MLHKTTQNAPVLRARDGEGYSRYQLEKRIVYKHTIQAGVRQYLDLFCFAKCVNDSNVMHGNVKKPCAGGVLFLRPQVQEDSKVRVERLPSTAIEESRVERRPQNELTTGESEGDKIKVICVVIRVLTRDKYVLRVDCTLETANSSLILGQ